MANDRDSSFRRERTARRRRLTAIQRDTAAEVTRLLREADDRIAAELARAPSDYRLWQLPRIQQEVRQALDEMAAGAQARLATAAGTAWQAGLDLVDAPIAAGGVNIAAVLPAVDTRQLLAMRAFMTDRIRDISLTAANRINAQIGLVAIGAQPPGAAIDAVAGILRTGGRGRAVSIVRTELGRAFSVAGQERQAQAAGILPGLKKQWRRSGKVHSRLTHDAADGQVREVAEPFLVGGIEIMFPRDPAAPPGETINCGCDSLPYMEKWDVQFPGRRPFGNREIAAQPFRRDLEDALS